MNRKWLVPHLLPAFATVLLGACAGATGSEETAQNSGAQEEADDYQPGRFPVQAELIDDLRCRWLGNCEGSGGTGSGGLGGLGGSGIPQHGDPPLTGLGSGGGPYWTDSYEINTGRVYYPRDAPAPYAGLALCGGFLNTGWEFTDWGEFYASWGIVTVITWTGSLDTPSIRGWALGSAIEELRGEASNPLSPLNGKMSGRYGTSGYSMGGGGTTVASQSDSSLKSSVGMAPWAPTGLGVSVPTLLICGDIDIIADCSHADWAYSEMSSSTPKMLAMISGGHLDWFTPSAGWGAGGGLGLAFTKVFLEGDDRWKSALLSDSHVYETNIY
jgi:hypothetical protein